jgi:hypothetical protein
MHLEGKIDERLKNKRIFITTLPRRILWPGACVDTQYQLSHCGIWGADSLFIVLILHLNWVST